MLRAVIIDDETDARENIASILSSYISDVEVVGYAANVKEGIHAIQSTKPDLVFLDIEMPDGTGLDLLKKLDPINFKVIFVTAHHVFAVQAFKFSALDYILKPPDPDEVIAAVEKAKLQSGQKQLDQVMQAFMHNMKSQKSQNKKIVLRTAENIHIVGIEDITRFEADVNYTTAYLTNGKKIMVSRTLKEFDDMVNGFHFFRSHRAHLINLNFVDRYHRADGGYIVMKDGSNVAVSNARKDELMALIEKM